MKFTLGLAQTCHPADGDVVALVDTYAAEAAAKKVDLLVFPESLMSRYEAELGDFLAQSEPVDGPFFQAVNAIAAQYGLWMVYTMNELNPAGKPFNTAVVVDSEGVCRGIYRKVHLFDSATTQESERMSASDKLFDPIETSFGKLGIAICYDLRFPEVARRAALMGCDLMVYPAAWVDGPNKRAQWQTLLAARAIENEMFVAGVCRADEGYVGTSCVYGPDGVVRGLAATDEALLVVRLDTADLAQMRQAIPVFDHRRPESYA